MAEPPSPTTAPFLLTDDDVLRDVEALVGPALRDGTLWLMFVDGDHRRAPVVMPIEETRYLSDELVDALGGVLAGFVPELATDAGAGAVVFVRERLGPAAVLPDDRDWARMLTAMCRARDIALRGVHLSTRGGVCRIS